MRNGAHPDEVLMRSGVRRRISCVRVDGIKGYLSFVGGLRGDAGTVTCNSRKLPQEAYNSSERMVR